MFFPWFPPWFSLMFFRWCCPSACCWWTSASSVAWCWQWIPWRTRTHYTAFGSACCGANGWKIRPMSVLIGRISGETSGDFFWLVVSNIFFIFHNIYIYFWMWTLTGWWFGTFFIFHFIYGIILPIDELIFFKMVIAPPTCWNPGQLGSLVREYYIIIYIYIYLGPVDEFWLIFSWKATMTWESIGPRIWSQGEGWDGHHATSVGCEYGNPKKRFNCSIWGLLKVVLGFDNSIFHHL